MIHAFDQARRQRGLLLATGQLTSYGSGAGVDDGALRKGIVKAYTILTLGQYALTTNITINGKTDVHSNNCVFDNNTGLMWSRTASASVGPASNGRLPWTNTGSGGTLEGIFAYCAAANAAALAGYSDWRVPNREELESLLDGEAPTGAPNTTAFPSFSTSVFTSSTLPNNNTQAIIVVFSSGAPSWDAKTATYGCALVRG